MPGIIQGLPFGRSLKQHLGYGVVGILLGRPRRKFEDFTLVEGIVDADGRLVYANDAAARLVGFRSAAEFMATPIPQVLSRFEMLDERGEPFPIDRLPGRLALTGIESEQVICYRVRDTGVRPDNVTIGTPASSTSRAVEPALYGYVSR